MKIDYPVGVNFVALVAVCFGAGYVFGTSSVGSLFTGFVISIISSYVFFFLTVKLKEHEDNKKISKITYPIIYNITESIEAAINDCLLQVLDQWSYKRKPSELKDEDLLQLLRNHKILRKELDYRHGVAVYDQFNAKPKNYKESFLLRVTLPVAEKLNSLAPYYPLLNKDIVISLSELTNSQVLQLCAKTLEHKHEYWFEPETMLEYIKTARKLSELNRRLQRRA
ncbi:hypothetical protein [Vibrio vulnificus]|uniref:hypothetical protein n=1 Tax=Vibrio vulnificus TaxID=672 RepID=UPI001CDC95C6|nr:hypothetical protein [Vibrio vulnificus]MCA3912548.1 hypothetical protein [Vibrio vulnificus]